MKKALVILAIFLIVVIVGSAIIFALMFYGNPVSRLLARRAAIQHLQENYGGTDYVIDNVFYDFKFGYYGVYVVSPSSIDGGFSITVSANGHFLYDSYESDVLNKGNVAWRIENSYRNAVKAVLEGASFSYSIDSGYGEICFAYDDRPEDVVVPPYAIPIKDLVIDAAYDTYEMGKRAGHLVLYVSEETPGVERFAEILLDIRQKMDAAGVGFVSIDCVFQSNCENSQERIEVMEFAYADIYEENLVERVREASEAARAYWEEQDKEKGI